MELWDQIVKHWPSIAATVAVIYAVAYGIVRLIREFFDLLLKRREFNSHNQRQLKAEIDSDDKSPSIARPSQEEISKYGRPSLSSHYSGWMQNSLKILPLLITVLAGGLIFNNFSNKLKYHSITSPAPIEVGSKTNTDHLSQDFFERRPRDIAAATSQCNRGSELGPSPTEAPISADNNTWNLSLLKSATVANVSSTLPNAPLRHTASRIIDGWYNNCRSWIPNDIEGYFDIDFGVTVIIDYIRIGSEHQIHYNDRAIKNWKIYSDSDLTTPIASADNVDIKATTTINLPNSISTRSIRIWVSNPTQPPRVDEVEVYGRLVPKI